MIINDERDLHERLEAAVGAIVPRPAPVDGTVRRGRAIRVRRRVAAAAGLAAAVAIGVFAVPSLVHRVAAPAPAAPVTRYSVTVQEPGPHSRAGLVASGTVDGKRWQFTVDKPGRGQQLITATGQAFGSNAAIDSVPPLAVVSADPVSFLGLSSGPVQVQYGAVRADVTYVVVRLSNGTVLGLHPVTVYGVRAVAFAAPVGASIVDAAAYSGHGEIATAVPFNSPGEMADFGVWLAPGRHGLARASGLIGSGAGWSAAAYLGPWGICFEVSRGGITSGSCVPTTSILGTGEMAWTGGSPGVAGGTLLASAAWVIVNQADGTRTKVWPVTVGGQKFFAFQTSGGTKPPSWTAYDSSGAVVGSSPR